MKFLDKKITHIHRLKRKPERHCQAKCEHIQAVFDGLLSAKVLLLYHL